MFRKSLLAAALVASSGMASAASTLVNSGVWSTNGHYYAIYKSDTDLTWAQAEAEAVLLGGHLASVTSAEENAFIYSLVAPHAASLYFADPGNQLGPYIGGYRTVSGGPFYWSDGETFSYTNWASGEPSNYGGQENALQFFANGTDAVDEPGEGGYWNDVGPNANGANLLKPYIVELTSDPNAVPEPASWALMIGGFALAGAALRGRTRYAVA